MTLRWNSLSSFKSSHIFGKLYYFCMHEPSAIRMFSAIFVLCLHLFHHEVLYIYFFFCFLSILLILIFISSIPFILFIEDFENKATEKWKTRKTNSYETRIHAEFGMWEILLDFFGDERFVGMWNISKLSQCIGWSIKNSRINFFPFSNIFLFLQWIVVRFLVFQLK